MHRKPLWTCCEGQVNYDEVMWGRVEIASYVEMWDMWRRQCWFLPTLKSSSAFRSNPSGLPWLDQACITHQIHPILYSQAAGKLHDDV